MRHHTFHGERMATARWDLHMLQLAPCALFPFNRP